MFLLPSIALGLVIALALGGRPRRLLELRLRIAWAAPLALVVQVLAFSRLVSLPPGSEAALHLGSYGILLAFAAANRRVYALLPVLAGMLLNALAFSLNGGAMPLSRSAAATAGLVVDSRANVSADAAHVRFLGDVFALPARVPLANVFSIGDLLIGFGMIGFIVFVSLGTGRERSLSASRLVAPLGLPAFRHLAAARLVSQIGDWLTLSAVVGWMFQTTHSTTQVAAVLLVRMAPPVLGGGIAAVVVDRLPKRPLLVAVELARGAAILVAFAAVGAGLRTEMLAALAVSGLLAAISSAAVPTLVPRLLSEELYAAGNATLGIADNAAMALGAVGGGVALGVLGIGPALIVDVATFVLAALLFGSLKLAAGDAERTAQATSRLYGLRYLLSRRRLLVLVLSFGAATLATGLVNATLPRLLELHAALGPGAYGYGFAAIATGLAAGQLAVGFLRLGPGASRWIGCGLLLLAALIALLGLEHHVLTIFLVLVGIGLVDGTTDIVFETVVQQEADEHVLGSVFGFAAAFVRTTMILSVAVAPVANRLLPVETVALVAAAFLSLAGVIALLGLRRASDVGAGSPAADAALPEPVPATRLRRLGSDLSVIAWGDLVATADTAATELAANGISVEVLDLGEPGAWDRAAVLETVAKTSKVMIVGNGGLDSELAALIVEQAFEQLDAPVRRLAAPAPEELAAGLRDLAEY